MTRYRKEFKKIAKKLTLADIQAGVSEDNLSLDNLFEAGRVKPTSNFLLGAFSKQGVMKVLEVFGFIRILDSLGLSKISIDLDTSDPHTHRLYAYDGAHISKNIICELVLKKGPLRFTEGTLPNFPRRNINLLQIEWILLQNPKEDFNSDRLPLPGQSHPGLGIGDRVMELVVIMTKRLSLEGIVNKPNFYHTAFMFTKEFTFTNPDNQAILHALSRDFLSQYSFYTLAWAIHFDCILNENDYSTFTWNPGYMILPISKDLIRYFRSKEYQREVQSLTKKYHFILNQSKLIDNMREHSLKIYDEINS